MGGGGRGSDLGAAGSFPSRGGSKGGCVVELSLPHSTQNGLLGVKILSIYWTVNIIFISTGALLWKIEQKSNRAFACGKVTIKGKRHWYEALPQAVFVALSDDTAWIIRTNGDLYLQTGSCRRRPSARRVWCDCALVATCLETGTKKLEVNLNENTSGKRVFAIGIY